MKKLAASFIVLSLLLVFCSCDHNVYEISMKTNGDVLERKLTVYRVVQTHPMPATTPGQPDYVSDRGNFPKEELEAIQKIYGKPVGTNDSGDMTFAGKFTGRTPQDVGGSGHYVRYESDMGTAKVYTERFRGTDDIAGIVYRMWLSSESVTDGLVGWFKAEMKDDPRLPKLVAFMNTSFRHDLKNLGLYAFAISTDRPVSTQPTSAIRGSYVEILARSMQYLADRDYFKPSDVPKILRAWNDPGEDHENMMSIIQRMVANKMGVGPNEAIPKSLAFLATKERASESFDNYLRATPEYKKILKEWESKRTTTSPASDPPSPSEALHADGLGVMGSFLNPVGTSLAGSTNDVVSVSLLTTRPPDATNGLYDGKTRQLRWKFGVGPGEKDTYAAFCYAAWCEPAVAVQKAHFGAVVLTDMELLKYCTWYKSLNASELKRWQEFARTLRPGPDLITRLQEFRLHPENKPAITPATTQTTQPADYSQEITSLLESALRAQTQPAR